MTSPTKSNLPNEPNAHPGGDPVSAPVPERQTQADNARALVERTTELGAERLKRVEAERIGRIKDEFLANLSHEIRTPLTAILGWAEHLRPGQSSDADMAEGLQVIRRNAHAQSRLVEDLLDMSRIISGTMRLDVQRVQLAAAIAAAVEVVHLAAAAKGVRIEVVVDPLAGPVSGDPGRVQQMIWNLLANAVKFTPCGGKIQVTVERVNSHIELSVSDTGQGIDPEFLPNVFDRFTQGAQPDLTRHEKGVGLGLAIVRHLAEMHGGSVRAKSGGPGKGSTFIITLPISVVRTLTADEPGKHPDAAADGDDLPCPDLTGTRAMIVDDDADALELIRRVLERCKMTVMACETGGQCLERIAAFRPDVLVSDIGMPGMDGYGLIRAIRALPPDRGGHTPAVALTAHARSADRRRAMLSGFDVHMARPVEPSELEAVVARLVRRT